MYDQTNYLSLNIAHNRTFGDLTNGQDVADGKRSLQASIDELTSV
jgi:hypothetical protein